MTSIDDLSDLMSQVQSAKRAAGVEHEQLEAKAEAKGEGGRELAKGFGETLIGEGGRELLKESLTQGKVFQTVSTAIKNYRTGGARQMVNRLAGGEENPDVVATPSASPPVYSPDDPVHKMTPRVKEGGDDDDAIEKAGKRAGEDDAEMGGPDDIVGDVISVAIGVGTLIGGLFHKKHTIPPVIQPNVTSAVQIGVG